MGSPDSFGDVRHFSKFHIIIKKEIVSILYKCILYITKFIKIIAINIFIY
jgi:hypothetical protein